MFCEHSLINLDLNYIVSRDIYFGLLHIMPSVIRITIFTWQESFSLDECWEEQFNSLTNAEHR